MGFALKHKEHAMILELDELLRIFKVFNQYFCCQSR